MLREILARGMLYWLRAPKDYGSFAGEQWSMASARLLLSAWLTIRMLQASSLPRGSYGIYVLIFTVYSLLVIPALRLHLDSHPAFHIGTHCLDIVWAAHLSLVVGWPGISLVLLVVITLSANLRWGFWETFWTAGIFSVLLAAGQYTRTPHVALNHRVMEHLLYVILGLVMGLLAEARARRMELNWTSALIESIRINHGLTAALRKACETVIRMFRATQMIMVLNDGEQNTLYRATNVRKSLRYTLLSPGKQGTYLSPAPAPCWRLEALPRTPQFLCATLSAGKIEKHNQRLGIPDSFLSRHPFHRLLAAELQFTGGLFARVYVLDPMPWFGGVAGLRFLDLATKRIAPALLNVFRLERLKSEVEVAVHRRVARELHDGAIQSLSSISLQLEQLRKCAGPALAEEAVRVAVIQKNIREEIAALREYASTLRSFELGADQLLGHLRQLALKFQCEQGISTRFVTDVDQVDLRPHTCGELARIAQEALVNVRKHSGASEVIIRFSRRNEDYVLGVIDNGRGLGFSGRRSHEELQSAGEGPRAILDRAGEINGRVSIESAQGSGCYIEVMVASENS